MNSARRRRHKFILYCLAFFGAWMGYVSYMVVATAERGFDPGGYGDSHNVTSCEMCHMGPTYPAQMQTFDAWGGFDHEPMHSQWTGVPSGFRM